MFLFYRQRKSRPLDLLFWKDYCALLYRYKAFCGPNLSSMLTQEYSLTIILVSIEISEAIALRVVSGTVSIRQPPISPVIENSSEYETKIHEANSSFKDYIYGFLF